MCCLEKGTARLWGLILVGCFVAGAVVCIIIAGINFQYVSSQWGTHGWGALGAVELAAIILVFIVGLIGFLGLLFENRPLLIIFIILLGISALFTISLAIFALVGGCIKYWDESIGCNSKYYGVLEAWASVDTYLTTVDQTLCSKDCPCYMNTSTAMKYISNTTSAPYYNQMFKTKNETDAFRFENCSETVRNATHSRYVDKNAYSNWTFNGDLFAQFWSNVERKWTCTGFCMTTYFNERTLTNAKMVKYLYNDIALHSGVPTYIGCLPVILDWLPATLNAYGSIALAVFLFELVCLIFSICLLCQLFQPDNQMNNEVVMPREEVKATNANAQSMEMVKLHHQGAVLVQNENKDQIFKPTESMVAENSQNEQVFQPSANHQY